MLDWPAFGDALWLVSDELGIRPEWQLPVLWLESKFNPSICNAGGCCGLNQLCPGTYGRYANVPVAEYRTWPASRQLSGPVRAYWRDALAFGHVHSATRLMIAQLGHGLLRSTPDLNGVVFSSPSREYAGNAAVFDPNRKGYFTVQDIAGAMTRSAQNISVCEALAQAYAARPNERPTDPVYGEDFPEASSGITCSDFHFVAPATKRINAADVAGAAVAATALLTAVWFGAKALKARRELEPEPFRYTLPPPEPDEP